MKWVSSKLMAMLCVLFLCMFCATAKADDGYYATQMQYVCVCQWHYEYRWTPYWSGDGGYWALTFIPARYDWRPVTVWVPTCHTYTININWGPGINFNRLFAPRCAWHR